MVGCAMRSSSAVVSQSSINLLSLDETEMAGLVAGFGWPAYRTAQILRWLYQRRARSISSMTDLSHADRAKLGGRAVSHGLLIASYFAPRTTQESWS